jgi:hypothetical protein
MKKLLLLIFLTLNYSTTKAQYRKMPLDTSHYWQQSYSAWLQPSPSVTCLYQLKVKKDSIVNGVTYQYIKSLNTYCNPVSNYSWTAILRQDSIKKIVVMLMNNQEKILYNFNKNAGDTALLFNGNSNSMVTYTVQTKDSLLLSDGFYHKRFVFINAGVTVIEGVGSNWGLITPWSPFEIANQIKCLIQKNPSFATIYSDGGIGTNCQLLTNIEEENDLKSNLSIFPNPTLDFLNIKTESLIPKYIEIKNILGQIILYLNNCNQDITTINIKDFTQGIYFIRVNVADKSISGHFIKN